MLYRICRVPLIAFVQFSVYLTSTWLLLGFCLASTWRHIGPCPAFLRPTGLTLAKAKRPVLGFA